MNLIISKRSSCHALMLVLLVVAALCSVFSCSCAAVDNVALRGSLLIMPRPPSDFTRSATSSKGVELSLRYDAADRDEAESVLDAAIQVADSLQDLYGPLPRHKLDVVVDARADRLKTRFNSGGVVHLQTRDLRMPREWLVGALAHEIAHEWWGLRVAADPRDRHGVTETLAEVSSLLIVAKKFGTKPLLRDVETLTASYLDGDLAPVATTRDKLYSKVIVMYWQLIHVVGEESFFRAARRTFAKYDGRELSHNAFFAVVEAESGMKIRWLLDWLYESDHDVDFSLSRITWEKEKKKDDDDDEENNAAHYVTRFSVLERLGRFDYPLEVPIRVESADGKSRRVDRVIRRNETTLTIETEAPVVAIDIDPDGVMWDVNRSNNSFSRRVVVGPSPVALVDGKGSGDMNARKKTVAEIVRFPNLLGIGRASLWLRDETEATLFTIPGRVSLTAVPTRTVHVGGRRLAIGLRTATQQPLEICVDMENRSLLQSCK